MHEKAVNLSTSPFPRRNFLELGGLSFLSVLLHSPKLHLSIETGNKRIVEIETPEATYYPMYESHFLPIGPEELQKLPKLDLALYEVVTPSEEALRMSPVQILNMTAAQREFVIPREHLALFEKNGTEVSVEGMALPVHAYSDSLWQFVGETVMGMAAASGMVTKLIPRDAAFKGSVNIAEKTAATWLMSRSVSLALGAVEGVIGSTVQQSAPQRILSRISAFIEHAHPEDATVFLRNILIARKLQFFGQFLSDTRLKLSKPRIAYNVGNSHGGIEDFLYLGKDFTLAILSAYPKEFLKEVIKVNGGLTAFCSSVLVTSDTRFPQKTVVVDRELKEFLKEN